MMRDLSHLCARLIAPAEEVVLCHAEVREDMVVWGLHLVVLWRRLL